MTLYLKYRPQKISELDLVRVRETLQKIVERKDMPHAFLFAGPKGTGKTSAARILAKAINCENPTKDNEPCNKCSQCVAITKGQSMDVIEMDAASNRGIDDIRALRENVNLAPSSAKKKIYILDEAHMLTTEAANAFLKTLEEPPSHAMFILATTDPQKLPSTVISRLTKITFTKATVEEIVGQLSKVARGEGLEISKEAMEIIAKAADGSFRDGVKIVEGLIAEGEKKIEKEQVLKFVRHIESDLVTQFLKLLEEEKLEEVLGEIDNLVAQGVDVLDFVNNLIEVLREELLANVKGRENKFGFTKEQLIELMESLMAVKPQINYSPVEQLPLEIVVIEFVGGNENPNRTEKIHKENYTKLDGKNVDQGAKTEDRGAKTEDRGAKTAPLQKNDNPVKLNGNVTFDKDTWAKVVLAAKESNNATVDALLRAVTPIELKDGELKLGVFYRFHKERLESNQHRRELEDLCSSVLGGQVKIACVLAERENHQPVIKNTIAVEEQKDILKAAEEVFGM